MRSQKSCNKLKTSFLELLSQSDGLPIRMTELLKLAGVSKTTFYVYYENLDQLAFDLIDEQLRELNTVLRLRRKNGAKIFSIMPIWNTLRLKFSCSKKTAAWCGPMRRGNCRSSSGKS